MGNISLQGMYVPPLSPPFSGLYSDAREMYNDVVIWKTNPFRSRRTQGRHNALGEPHGADQLAVVDSRLGALCVGRAGYACVRVERGEADEEHRDQECRARRREWRAVA